MSALEALPAEERRILIHALSEATDDLEDRIDRGDYDHDDPPNGLARQNLADMLGLLKRLTADGELVETYLVSFTYEDNGQIGEWFVDMTKAQADAVEDHLEKGPYLEVYVDRPGASVSFVDFVKTSELYDEPEVMGEDDYHDLSLCPTCEADLSMGGKHLLDCRLFIEHEG